MPAEAGQVSATLAEDDPELEESFLSAPRNGRALSGNSDNFRRSTSPSRSTSAMMEPEECLQSSNFARSTSTMTASGGLASLSYSKSEGSTDTPMPTVSDQREVSSHKAALLQVATQPTQGARSSSLDLLSSRRTLPTESAPPNSVGGAVDDEKDAARELKAKADQCMLLTTREMLKAQDSVKKRRMRALMGLLEKQEPTSEAFLPPRENFDAVASKKAKPSKSPSSSGHGGKHIMHKQPPKSLASRPQDGPSGERPGERGPSKTRASCPAVFFYSQGDRVSRIGVAHDEGDVSEGVCTSMRIRMSL